MRCAPGPFRAAMSAGASILTGPDCRLLIVGLYTSDSHGPLAADRQCTTRTSWWPKDVAQWQSVSAAAAQCLLRNGLVLGTAKGSRDASLLGPVMYDAMGRTMEAADARLIGVAMATAPVVPCYGGAETRATSDVTVVDKARTVHTFATDETADEWLAFCRLVALRDATLWRALSVDPSAYGERGAHVATSILRSEEAIARRRRFDPALVDADEIAALRRAFVAAADGHRLATPLDLGF
ncbi:hypothetical protein pneo_cds_858 [Pandoravirus neocaledonia]|uniref:Uncharacterized protein n=1 Tax=Pandoravirus neocaledonia TaxID=2107708 RepID=A0A2U7UDN4_9VIRU|nr:hypothetical protein pneo_cds_858 [Pandoravirus neocaledonia]AVK76465.1 hypothetical protein pneo_cds_858 [Pandoravirus neocaledonia]